MKSTVQASVGLGQEMGYFLENVPQLHRLSANGMKLSEFVGLVNVSIVVDF